MTTTITPPPAEARFYNCQPDFAAPDWTRFAALELAGCVAGTDPHDPAGTWVRTGIPAARAEFFGIFGRAPDGAAEAITDCPDAIEALAVAAALAALSGLPLRLYQLAGE